MTHAAGSAAAPAGARRVGYGVGALVNAVLLVLVNLWPGWDAVPFLTADTERVVGFVNASILAGLLTNLVYLLRDPAWLKSFGTMLTTGVGLAAIVAMWRVFPFDFDGSSTWELVTRILLGIAAVGSAIGFVVALIGLRRSPPRPRPAAGSASG
ncbi:hypothetical protein [Nocardioides mesophilus]|uniref:Uncharacterized protein n=1 Tax=Nocardioides mesophilus TaxID=433659 RepID=A0A7G9R8Q1_9ACTN|nr:hypothetical protein [Nocardioides mesophilus]QNN51976.1 hypothetical protein H9L09_15845 [Nocardioides mesophilus]